MIVCADSKEEALKVVESDIYTESGVWDMKKVDIRLREKTRGLANAITASNLPVQERSASRCIISNASFVNYGSLTDVWISQVTLVIRIFFVT